MTPAYNMRYLEYKQAYDGKPKDIKEYRYQFSHYADKCCHKINELDNVCQEFIY